MSLRTKPTKAFLRQCTESFLSLLLKNKDLEREIYDKWDYSKKPKLIGTNCQGINDTMANRVTITFETETGETKILTLNFVLDSYKIETIK